MGAVVERLDLSTADKTEMDVIREYLRVSLSTEGTLVEAEYIGVGDGATAVFPLDHAPVLSGTLRLFVSGVLQVEGTDYSINLATGVITFLLGYIPILDAPITGSYSYGASPIGADDTILTNLYEAAKVAADNYLNNPFEIDVPQITFASAVAGDRVTIDGVAFEATAGATDIPEHKFNVGGTDTQDATELCSCINSNVMGGDEGAYGIAGVLATNVSGVVKLTKRSGRVKKILVSGSVSRLLVEYVRTEDDLPKAIHLWVLQRIAKTYERRTESLKAESISGLGSQSWDEEDFSLLVPLRLSPGL